MNLESIELFTKNYVPPKGIHAEPCKLCPSAHYPIDPECEEILKLSLAGRVETAFSCAWRTGKYCKGYCDRMGISEHDLEQHKQPAP